MLYRFPILLSVLAVLTLATPLAAGTDSAPCVADDTTLCLNDDRFEVTVRWTAPQGTGDLGQARELTEDSGYFWFFDENNVELIVKLLDGRPVNGFFWFFTGSLTNVQMQIFVRDVMTGAERVYRTEQGEVRQFQDVRAFSDDSGQICGGIAGLVCPSGEFCQNPPGTCLVSDQQGTCELVPEVCTLQLAPVCGCDGMTYDNDCFRSAARVSKAHDGPCD